MNNLEYISSLVETLNSTIYFFRIQDYFHGNKSYNQVILSINNIVAKNSPSLSEDDILAIANCLPNILEAQEHNNYVLLSDLLEASLLPCITYILEELSLLNSQVKPLYLDNNIAIFKKNSANDTSILSTINSIINNAKKIEKTNIYEVEMTNIGVPTFKKNIADHSIYYHSNLNPLNEGRLLAKYYSKSDVFSYSIFGFGFGYHIRELLAINRCFFVTSIETNLDILTLAFMYCNLSDILSNPRFTLKYIDINDLSGLLDKNTNSLFLIHYPSLCGLSSSPAKKLLNNYFINYSSSYSQQKYLDWNFHDNIKLNNPPADTLISNFTGSDIIFVAGGPSLKYYINYLHKCKENSSHLIICASTVYRTLLSENIVPDYVIMIDAQDNMVTHFEKTSKTNAELIYLSTSCHEAVCNFKGNKYILFQKGYPSSEAYASENNLTLIETGGSVSTTAIDICIRYGCVSLTTIGLDLAYTDNKTHCYDADSVDTSKEFIFTEDVSGNKIPTTNVLTIYKTWIERRIVNESSIEFINMSHGAFIKGMKNII